MVVSGGSVWVLREKGRLVRVEPATGDVVLEAEVGRGAKCMAVAANALWVACWRGRKLARIDPGSGRIDEEVRLPHRAIRLAADDDRVWVACGRRRSPRRGWLYAIDADTGDLGPPVEMSGEPRALTAGRDAVWVASAPRRRREGVIERVDPSVGTAQAWLDTNWPVFDLTTVNRSLLATMSLRIGGPVDMGGGVFDLGGGGGGGDGGGGGHHS